MILEHVNRSIRLSLKCVAVFAWILAGCATGGPPGPSSKSSHPAVIEAIKVHPGGDVTSVEILNSKPAPYSTLELPEPRRLVLDIRGLPGSSIQSMIRVNDGNISEIHVEKGKTQATTTRVEVGFSGAADYKVADQANLITITFAKKKAVSGSEIQAGTQGPDQTGKTKEVGRPKGQVVEPRIFFKPRGGNLNQVLGVDFTMLDHGKSRLTVTTAGKVRYHLTRKGSRSLLLTLKDTTIPPLLLRRLDSSHFEGAVDQIRPRFSAKDRSLSLLITFREMVPFHLDQTASGLYMDFGPTSIRPPKKVISPLKGVGEKGISPEILKSPGTATATKSPKIPGLVKGKRYTGRRMTMDFVKAEVTNILRLIGEVSNLNIIWGPEVRGTVSMRLKNVPWDQALDLVLANNDLAMRRQGNVIWVTTRNKLSQIETEEKRKRKEAEAELEATRKKKLEAQKRSQELEPLVTEYFPVDFAKAQEIKGHIDKIKSKRGSVSVDERTNTVIVKDTSAQIEEAGKIVKRFDTPVKQIMIEARIVDASTSLSRDLGIKWNSISGQQRNRAGASFGLPPTPTTFTAGGDRLYGGSFSSNSPSGWVSNIGLSFGRLSSSGLGTIALDAQLALAETEGKAKIISAPKVIASNGEKAKISRGDIIYREIVTADQITVKELPATLSLTVTPTVSYNNYVTMDVEVTDDKVFADLSGKTEKTIKTKLMVKSGETFVIGGVFKEDRSDSESGVPWLKDVPVLGYLFKARTKTEEKTELLIFVTPRVVQMAGRTD